MFEPVINIISHIDYVASNIFDFTTNRRFYTYLSGKYQFEYNVIISPLYIKLVIAKCNYLLLNNKSNNIHINKPLFIKKNVSCDIINNIINDIPGISSKISTLGIYYCQYDISKE